MLICDPFAVLHGEVCAALALDLTKMLSLLLDIWLLMLPLIMSALYVWCQLNRDTVVTFWFGTQFKVGGC